ILLINLLLVFFITGVMLSFNVETISTEGVFLFAFSIGTAGTIGAGIAIVTAQIAPTSSGAAGFALGITGFFCLVRASTDVANVDLSVWNPVGWIYLDYAFIENNWTPLIYAFIFNVVFVLIAFILEEKRDMGAGFLPQREGKANAKRSLMSILGLFLKLNKGTIISWFFAFILLGGAYGSIYGDMQTFLESNKLV